MPRVLMVAALVTAAGCGAASPNGQDYQEATWSFSASNVLACGPGGRLIPLDPRAPFDQWCVWDCATYGGIPGRRVVVRMHLTGDVNADPATGAWVEQVSDRPSTACG